MKLELTNRIINNQSYIREISNLKALEMDRKFCRHDTEHFLSVARITMLLCIESGMDADPDMIYAAALLHDIGRSAEYKYGVPHDIAGKDVAEKILTEVGCDEDMKAAIISLIVNHRNKNNPENSLEYLFYRADKKSRLCFECPAQDECNWSAEKRNMDIEV